MSAYKFNNKIQPKKEHSENKYAFLKKHDFLQQCVIVQTIRRSSGCQPLEDILHFCHLTNKVSSECAIGTKIYPGKTFYHSYSAN